jgi:hypothetical protein
MTIDKFTNRNAPSAVFVEFKKWTGRRPGFDFGRKPLIEYNGSCVFAEIAILKMLKRDGWNGVWVSTYGGCNFLNTMPKSRKFSKYSKDIPEEKKELLEKIWKTGKTRACFDIFAWKKNEVIFCEAKRKSKDKLTLGQRKFIQAALACGIKNNQLTVVEWDFFGRLTGT